MENAAAALTDHKARIGANYIAERVVTPLFAGADFDDPIMFYSKAPAPPVPSDTVRTP
jgi:hypothetical protein